jgi:hypothetical protein
MYYFETDSGYKTAIHLSTGLKQKGVLKSTQESLVYQF